MRFSYFKMIYDMIVTLKDALSHVKATNDLSMLGVCVQSLQAIIKALAPCSADIKKHSVIDNLNSMIAILSSENVDVDAAISLSEKLVSDCRNGLSYKIRVLFVAELGGKWDSMASVYEECMKRNDIEVDVVLEPVFREVKLPDGSIRHEEANYDWLTPMGIKHIPCKQYDMKKKCPDMTFFSQPYEGCTDSMFWPENMAKYTRVVYLPYYTVTTMHKSSPAYHSFLKSDTQEYSWRIICQSETLKKYYTEDSSRQGENVVVAGLPKWDYPIRLSKNNTYMPDEWKNKLEGKTVFLWNTHFTVDSSGSQLFTTKAIDFIKIFLNNSENIGLIWRPHPMLETVVKIYYPKEVWQYYTELKETFEKSTNMVIDTFESYDAAFTYSDAMISDRSSMIDQYIFLHKPILILTNQNIEDEKKYLCHDPELCDYTQLEFANTLDMQVAFIEDVCNDKGDIYVDRQESIIQDYFSLADGKCGERAVQMLINELIDEKSFNME